MENQKLIDVHSRHCQESHTSPSQKGARIRSRSLSSKGCLAKNVWLSREVRVGNVEKRSEVSAASKSNDGAVSIKEKRENNLLCSLPLKCFGIHPFIPLLLQESNGPRHTHYMKIREGPKAFMCLSFRNPVR